MIHSNSCVKKEKYNFRKSGVVNDSSPRIDLEKAFDVNIHGFATVHKIIVLLVVNTFDFLI